MVVSQRCKKIPTSYGAERLNYFRCNYNVKLASQSNCQLIIVQSINCVTEIFKIINSSHSPFTRHSYFLFLNIIYLFVFFINAPKAVIGIQGLQKASHFCLQCELTYAYFLLYSFFASQLFTLTIFEATETLREESLGFL